MYKNEEGCDIVKIIGMEWKVIVGGLFEIDDWYCHARQS